MPRMRWRVVCGFGDTMLTGCSTSALSSVDLPTFGRPASAAKPQRNDSSAIGDAFQQAARRLLLGVLATVALAALRETHLLHLGTHGEMLLVRLSFDALDRVARSRQATRLEELLESRLRILEVGGGG